MVSATDSGINIPRRAMQPTDRIAVTLDAQTWETVLRVIAQAPVAYAVTAPLIAEIQRQCTDHQQQNRPTLVERVAE